MCMASLRDRSRKGEPGHILPALPSLSAATMAPTFAMILATSSTISM